VRRRRRSLGELPKIKALAGDDKPIGTCWCTRNPRTKRGVRVCVVPKSKKHRNGRRLGGSCS
jgi:hypothetical protein